MTPARRRRAIDWRALVGIALSIGFLVFALRGVNLGSVVAEIGRANMPLFLLAILCTALPMWVRSWRWKALLAPAKRDTTFHSRFAAVNIGFMANNLLPARIGEFLRAYVLSRLEPVPVVASLGSLVIERLFDGLTLVALTFVALAAPSFPRGSAGSDVHAAAVILGAVFVGIALLLLAMVIWPRRVVALAEAVAGRLLPRSFRRPLVDALEALLTGLAAIRDPALFVQITLWSFANWLVGGLAYWLGLLAFGIQIPFTGGLFLQSVVSFSVAIPSSPGFFGVFEAAVRLGLVQIWHVDATKAVSFAVGFHIGGFVIVTLMGLYYVWRLGFSWREVKGGERAVEGTVERELEVRSTGGRA